MKKLEAEIPCPKCGAVFTQVLEEMRPGVIRRCSHCGIDIRFTGDDGAELQAAVDRLNRTLKDISRRLSY